ncbi:hypothetical protein RJD11_09985 [Bacillus velezensis]|uniref:hypothetical protein n=1 Tax=Bacillus TaxID=1386 RepID=UPI001C52C131|nr:MULTISPECIES: hypothetical protein [Bacillus amyloliquefaciens group]QXP99001.1 hypothetical protein KVY05_09900 [Bacillus velezensis]UHH04829.1 hypothetical protein LUA14_09945 [Bacillus amyloliquefaciens]ULR24556.1 hypothetical protein MJE83_09945 [Bacillus velezensis]UVW11366.1 hypothetical protein NX856_09980 [Bacillus velezensis]WHL78703.1 hypothetical protein QLH34_09965 [Bacillus velezensis]
MKKAYEVQEIMERKHKEELGNELSYLNKSIFVAANGGQEEIKVVFSVGESGDSITEEKLIRLKKLVQKEGYIVEFEYPNPSEDGNRKIAMLIKWGF